MNVPQPTHAQIAERAYQIYLANGSQPGHAEDDWLQAEYELMGLPVRELARVKPSPNPKRVAGMSVIGVVHAALWLAQMMG